MTGFSLRAAIAVLLASPALGAPAQLFEAHCAACHGAAGGGDGPLAPPLSEAGVHPRNFQQRLSLRGRSDAELADLIARGGAAYGLSNLMPPWGKVLSPAQIRSLVPFVRGLAEEHARATPAETASFRAARPVGYPRAATLFALYCTVCHGKRGEGDGPAAVAIRDAFGVAPMDLTDPHGIGTRSDAQLFEIISSGGPRVGRSNAMPAWGMTLTPDEVRGIIAYLRTLEKHGAEGRVVLDGRPRAGRGRP